MMTNRMERKICHRIPVDVWTHKTSIVYGLEWCADVLMEFSGLAVEIL